MKDILIVVDMQNDFIDGSLGTPEAQAIVLNVSERVKAAVQDGEKLIFTQDTHPKNYLQTAEGKKLPVEHCIKPSHGWALTSSLIPYAKDAVVLEKPTFGATGLPQHVAGFDEITVIGLCTDICVISNAMLLKAFLPEAKICVDSNCCAGVTPESHLRALEAMKMCQIAVENE